MSASFHRPARWSRPRRGARGSGRGMLTSIRRLRSQLPQLAAGCRERGRDFTGFVQPGGNMSKIVSIPVWGAAVALAFQLACVSAPPPPSEQAQAAAPRQFLNVGDKPNGYTHTV